MTKTTVGVIGAGSIVTKAHLPMLAAMEDVAMSWIYDRVADRATEAGLAYQLQVLRAEEEVTKYPTDIVLVAVPYGVRRPYYAALRTPALYVEKPFARTMDEHRNLCSERHSYQIACGL